MPNVLEFNGITYMVTSALVLNDNLQSKGLLYNFSMAVVDPVSKRKQIALNCLTIEKRTDKRTNAEYLAISSPKQRYNEKFCSSIVFMPDPMNNTQNEDRRKFINQIRDVVAEMAQQSLKNKKRPD